VVAAERKRASSSSSSSELPAAAARRGEARLNSKTTKGSKSIFLTSLHVKHEKREKEEEGEETGGPLCVPDPDDVAGKGGRR